MDVALTGTSPSALTAGIMLLTRARQLGFQLSVSIVGVEDDITPVPGPAVVYAPVMASCGVGRDLGSGATVVVPGPPGAPVLVSATPHGTGGWFLVDRTGEGCHPATRAYVALSRDPRVPARELAKGLRRVLEALGVSPDPAVLDVLFGAPAPPLLRMALALRAGRAMSGGRGEPITRWLSGRVQDARDPLPATCSPTELMAQLERGQLRWVLDRLNPAIRDRVEDWVDTAMALSKEDAGRDLPLLVSLFELGTHLAQLPQHSILPPLGAAEDSIAVALKAALNAEGDSDATRALAQVYRFLGGRFVDEAEHPLVVSLTPAPESTDVPALWQWFSQETRVGRKRADALWEEIFDPAQ
ncbi:MAG: hypothetical protein H6732_05550 [Alphaproteobacteria bacterium]|nr:hypothetical protein [Alphaproteobacteria bacterium]